MNLEDQGSPRFDHPILNLFSDDEILNFVNMTHSMHKCVQSEGSTEVRGAFFRDSSSVVPKLVDAGLVPKLLEFVAQENNSDLLQESLSCLAIISSEGSPFIEHIIELGGIDILFNHLDSDSCEVIDTVLWAFSNITSSGINVRDLCLKKGISDKLTKIFTKFPISVMRNETVLWIISNLTRGKPFPDWKAIYQFLPLLHLFISQAFSDGVLERALFSLVEISGNYSYPHSCNINEIAEKIQEVIDQGCVLFLIKHLFGSERVISASLKVLGNLLTGTEDQTIEILKFDEFLPRLFEFTQSSKLSRQREAFWIISNLTAGGPIEKDLILKNNDYISKIKIGVTTASPDVAAEAGWAICNLISTGNRDQVEMAIKHYKIMESFTAILMLPKPELRHKALDAILTVLQITGNDCESIYLKEIEEARLVEIVKNLTEEDEFREKVQKILEFFEKIRLKKANGEVDFDFA